MASEQPHRGRQQTNNHWMQNELNKKEATFSFVFKMMTNKQEKSLPRKLAQDWTLHVYAHQRHSEAATAVVRPRDARSINGL